MFASRLGFACLIVLVGALHADAADVKHPNILWIVGENICLDLGCYGAKHVATPNLDRLAAEGMRYTNVFATAPVCSASRSAFMTGMYQTTIDAQHARSHRDDGYKLPTGVRPITYRMREMGYYTVNLKTIGDRTVGTGKVDLNFDVGPKLWEADTDWSALPSHQPFFVQVNMPEVEYDIYDRQSWKKDRVEWVGEREHPQIAKPEDVTLPPYYPDHPVARQEWARFLNSVSGMDVRIGEILRKLESDGLADDTIVIFFADNGRMEPRGIHWCYDEGLHVPMIIRFPKNFPSPPGWKIGGIDERLISLIDVTATTLDLSGFGKTQGMKGRVLFGPNIDAQRKFAFSARDRIDETEQRIRTVRTARYRYIRNFRPDVPVMSLNRYKERCFLIVPLMRELQAAGKLNDVQTRLMQTRLPDEELYDLEKDPFEIDNLMLTPYRIPGRPSSAPPPFFMGNKLPEVEEDVLATLRKAVDTFIADTDDHGRFTEPREIVAPFEKEMHDWFGTPAWYKKVTP